MGCPISFMHAPALTSGTALPGPLIAAAARTRVSVTPDRTIASEFNITNEDMAIVYMSPDPFFDSFEEELDLRKWSFDKHRTASLSLVVHNGRLYLGGITPSTLGAKVDRWHVNLRGAWLIKIGSTLICQFLMHRLPLRPYTRAIHLP